MLYMVPGAVAGLVVSLILVLLNRILAWFSSDRLRLSAHARLIIFCLAVVGCCCKVGRRAAKTQFLIP